MSMKKGYKCDKKLKIYDHLSFYESNLLRAKKLYCPNGGSRGTVKRRTQTQNGGSNINSLMKKYWKEVSKMKGSIDPNAAPEEEYVIPFEVYVDKCGVIQNIMKSRNESERDRDMITDFLIDDVVYEGIFLCDDSNDKDYDMRLNRKEPNNALDDFYKDNSREDIKENDAITEESEKDKTFPEKSEDNKENSNLLSTDRKNENDSDEKPLDSSLTLVKDLLKKRETDKKDQRDIKKMIKYNEDVKNKFIDYYKEDEDAKRRKEEEEEKEKQRKLFEKNNDKQIYDEMEKRILSNTNSSNIYSKGEDDSFGKRENCAKKIQHKYKNYLAEKNKPKGRCVVRKFDSSKTNLISIFLKKVEHDEVKSIDVLIYSKETKQTFSEVLTEKELKDRKILKNTPITTSSFEEKKEKIADKILDIYMGKSVRETENDEPKEKSKSEEEDFVIEEEHHPQENNPPEEDVVLTGSRYSNNSNRSKTKKESPKLEKSQISKKSSKHGESNIHDELEKSKKSLNQRESDVLRETEKNNSRRASKREESNILDEMEKSRRSSKHGESVVLKEIEKNHSRRSSKREENNVANDSPKSEKNQSKKSSKHESNKISKKSSNREGEMDNFAVEKLDYDSENEKNKSKQSEKIEEKKSIKSHKTESHKSEKKDEEEEEDYGGFDDI